MWFLKIDLQQNERQYSLTYKFPLQFHDGVYLIFLLGLLEGFFVPLYQFYITPSSKEQKVGNIIKPDSHMNIQKNGNTMKPRFLGIR